MNPSSQNILSRKDHQSPVLKTNNVANPIKKSAVMVDWESVFANLFRKISPERLPEIPEVLVNFEGMYESALTSLCAHYQVSVPIEYFPIPVEPTSPWTRLRVARLLIKRVGANIFHLPQLEEAMQDLQHPKANPDSEFERLERRFGPEPSPSDHFTLLERVTLACAMSGKMEVRHRFMSQINIQSENPDIIFKNAMDELPNGEILWEDVADPRDIRTRLKAFLRKYDKPLLKKMDTILEAAGDPITLFSQLQRAYGREPKGAQRGVSAQNIVSDTSPNQDFYGNDFPVQIGSTKKLSHFEGLGQAGSKDASEDNKDKLHDDGHQSNQALHLEALRNDIFIMPKSYENGREPAIDRLFDKIAEYILQASSISPSDLKKITTRIFSVLDRSMLPIVDALVSPRCDPSHKYDYEMQEWLQFLHCSYINTPPPQTNNMSLRTVVSLLYMKLGGAIWEVKAAGGVDAFLEKVGSQFVQEQQDRAFNLRVMYGSVPDEADLALRNRKRIWFHHYNPNVPREKIDFAVDKVLATNKEGRKWEDSFRNLFGPPPRPISILENRVRDILRRFAHTKESEWRTIAEAHTDIDDTPRTVIHNLVRTYGPERSEFDHQLETSVLRAECEERFRVFSHEMRTRDVILRRASATLNSADAKGSRIVDQRLHLKKMLVAKSAEDDRKRVEKGKNDLKTLQLSQIDALISEENYERQDVETEERALREPISAEILRVFPQSDTYVALDISESIIRHILEDESRSSIRELKARMNSELEFLESFLAERLLWRRKWEIDEEIRVAILEMKDFEKQREDEQRKEREQFEAAKRRQYDTQSRSLEENERIQSLYNQLNAQVRRNLSFQVEVENLRAQIKSEEKQNDSGEELRDRHYHLPAPNPQRSRPLHNGCAFSRISNFENVDRYVESLRNAGISTEPTSPRKDQKSVKTQHEEDPPSEDEVNYMFLEQLREYIRSLFHKYDPKLEGTEKQLLTQFAGKEAKLIAALEQQYNVNHWIEQNLHHRLSEYYRRMAPDSMDEIPAVIQRFIGNEEGMWSFLKDRHGPVPALLSQEMQKYIRDRLIRYFSRRAPHYIQDIDRYVVLIGGNNGDALFRDLARTFGPEDPPVQLDTLVRKLRRFYRERDIRRPFDDIPIIARRFLGHEGLLNKLLRAKFDDDLEYKLPDVSDFSI